MRSEWISGRIQDRARPAEIEKGQAARAAARTWMGGRDQRGRAPDDRA
jgi:hypothetical protein